MILVLAATAALAILLIFLGLSAGRGSAMTARLERYGSGQETSEPHKQPAASGPNLITSSAALASLNKVVERRDWGANLARDLARADVAMKPSEFLAIRVATFVGLPLLTFVLGLIVPGLRGPIALVVAAVLGLFIPRFWLRRRIAKRLKAFNAALADTITLIANALRAGSSFLQAIEMVVRETQPPISTEFGRLIREVNLGLPFEQALSNMVRRVKSDDLELMVTAISVQHQVGGNLAEILDSIAFTIRERVRIKGEIRTLTAQQKMSGYVVGFLPLGLMGVISLISPGFMTPMFQTPPAVAGLPAGMIILSVGAVMMIMGFAIIRRIVDIEV